MRLGFVRYRLNTVYLIHNATFAGDFDALSLVMRLEVVRVVLFGVIVISFVLLLLGLALSLVRLIIGNCVFLSMVKLLLKSCDVASNH